MQDGMAARLLLTVISVGCVVYTAFLERPGYFPFSWSVVDPHTIVVEPRQGFGDSSLQAGDRLDLRRQSMQARAALYLTTMPGEGYSFVVRRDDELLQIPVLTRTQNARFDYLNALLLMLVLALGLVTLWWGRDWAAWGLSTFAMAFIVNNFLFLPLPPTAAFVTTLVNWTVITPLITIGLYAAALTLLGPSIRPYVRRLLHVALAIVLLATLILTNAQLVGVVVFADTRLAQYGLHGILFAVSLSIPLAVLLLNRPRDDAGRRLRIRWVSVSLLLLLVPMAWSNLADVRGEPVRELVWWSALLAGVAGLLYAVLRKRVVAISFAINRALVFGVVAAFVIGVFALLGVVAEEAALGRDASLALTLGVSLTIGLILEALRDRINAAVERVFFRHRFVAEQALRRFARQCSHMTRRDRLLHDAVEEVYQHTRPNAVAIYEESRDAYVRVGAAGEPGFPERVDRDDRAFVHLRAELGQLSLGEVGSVLGEEGYAFPMAVRGSLRGAVVCGSRTEAYTKGERNLIAYLAQQVGIALHALQARDSEAFIEELASGAMAPSVARTKAQQLYADQIRPR